MPPLKPPAAVLPAPALAPTLGRARRDAIALGLALLALLAWDQSGFDRPLAQLYGNAAGFAWRDHWLTAGLMHEGVRRAVWVVFAGLLLWTFRPGPLMRTVPVRERVWWLAVTLGCAMLIPLLKRASATSCPWSLAEFGGGLATYVSHWALGVRDGGPGGCFPSGHASSAFAFLAGWFVWRDRAPRLARLWLGLVLVVGLAAGWSQMMRGAHYASHTLWTAWICWACTAATWHASRAWRTGATAH